MFLALCSSRFIRGSSHLHRSYIRHILYKKALKSSSESSKISWLLECLDIVTFIGANDPEETERLMQIMWQLLHPNLGSNVVARKPSTEIRMIDLYGLQLEKHWLLFFK